MRWLSIASLFHPESAGAVTLQELTPFNFDLSIWRAGKRSV